MTLHPDARWGHVRSAANPADLATRGTTPEQLLNNEIWWSGPHSVFKDANNQAATVEYTTALEQKSVSSAFHVAPAENIDTFIARFSCLKRMLNVLSFARRWKSGNQTPPAVRPIGPLSAVEIESTRNCLILQVQKHHYGTTLSRLQNLQPLRKDDPLRQLSPFVDKGGLLRVGGRLQFSFLTEDEKHPILIPRASHLAELLIRDAHETTLHGGPQLIQSHLL